jgi:hypothetical protein
VNEHETARRRIAATVRKREEARQAWREATRDLERYCREARGLGVPVTEIAQLAGISRQAVYDLLKPDSRAD